MNEYIITGASSDIGQALLKEMDKRQLKVTVIGQCFSNTKVLEKMSQELQYVNLLPSQCDLSNSDDANVWIEGLKDANIFPNHIIHLAACRFEYMRLKQFDWEKTSKELTIQVNSLAQLFKAFLPTMAKEKSGKVVAMLTAYTIGVPPKYMSDYIISKYALLALIKCAASEYAGKGISINAISPNMIETKFLSNLDERVIEMSANESSMKRNIGINEVIDNIMYLLSDASDYMNGVNLNLSGGDRMY